MSSTSRVIINRLKRENWVEQSHTGSHITFRKKGFGIITIPHPRKDFPTGTLNAIYKKAGWK